MLNKSMPTASFLINSQQLPEWGMFVEIYTPRRNSVILASE
jgi:hypothetical protein